MFFILIVVPFMLLLAYAIVVLAAGAVTKKSWWPYRAVQLKFAIGLTAGLIFSGIANYSVESAVVLLEYFDTSIRLTRAGGIGTAYVPHLLVLLGFTPLFFGILLGCIVRALTPAKPASNQTEGAADAT